MQMSVPLLRFLPDTQGKQVENRAEEAGAATRCEIGPVRWGGNAGKEGESLTKQKKYALPAFGLKTISSLEVSSNQNVRERHQF